MEGVFFCVCLRVVSIMYLNGFLQLYNLSICIFHQRASSGWSSSHCVLGLREQHSLFHAYSLSTAEFTRIREEAATLTRERADTQNHIFPQLKADSANAPAAPGSTQHSCDRFMLFVPFLSAACQRPCPYMPQLTGKCPFFPSTIPECHTFSHIDDKIVFHYLLIVLRSHCVTYPSGSLLIC